MRSKVDGPAAVSALATAAVAIMTGVMKAKVSYDKREARFTFDDNKTNVAAQTKATTDVGYPSFRSDSQL
jgi:periplasmic mercuric ion binding protein